MPGSTMVTEKEREERAHPVVCSAGRRERVYPAALQGRGGNARRNTRRNARRNARRNTRALRCCK